jgi:toxin ParE1/3/4
VKNQIQMSARRPDIRLTSGADRDVAQIALHTESIWSQEQSFNYAAAITQTFAMLRDHPQLGRQREDIFPGCRSVQVEHHIVYYHQPHEDVISIVRVLHRRQDATTLVRDPGPLAPDEP